ncbi:WD repeat protein [Rhizoctonia solani]|uniref:WD repeat protein n=1 Tax=Rhizoctonia solani TaxID=456999 RepID=A0A8H8SZZ2_9AGAM|nr:WD repeat protein [Rhizoctonia solani]QRW24836.1 WD repeat protein [Rhizoctonia solani]
MAGRGGAWQAMTPPSPSEMSGSFSDDETKNGDESDSEESAPQKLFSEKRHFSCGNPRPTMGGGVPSGGSRRSYALLGPPLSHVQLECWVDPFSMPSNKALEAIGRNLQHQFENLNPRMNYKPYLDPSVEDTRKWCIGLRKMVGRECALFYYNGRQYIPVSIQDLQSWLGSPCVFVWDCSAAGNIVSNFLKFAEQKDQQARMDPAHQDPQASRPFMDCIQLAACAADEVLPMTPELPADVFTACLTSPIEWPSVSLLCATRFHPTRLGAVSPTSTMSCSSLVTSKIAAPRSGAQLDFHSRHRHHRMDHLSPRHFPQALPPRSHGRRSLSQFFTCRAYHAQLPLYPQSYPPLPPSHNHPLWNSWDLAVDSCLAQLPQLRAAEEQRLAAQQDVGPGGSQTSDAPGPYQYVPSSFFGDHLTAFQVWLTRGAALSKTVTDEAVQPIYFNTADSSDESEPRDAFRPRRGILVPRRPPDQLPIILQVLLSQTHRLRALILLSQFMDLGPWAVHLALAIGIFPYVQKLLQSPAQELKPVLVFVWARLLAVDRSCREDLLRDDGYMYFVNILSPHTGVYIPNSAEHRAMCAFILSIVARDHPEGQMACLRASVFHMCLIRLDDADYLLRQWSALCIAQLWDGNDDAKKYGIDQGAQDKLSVMMSDHSPNVRAAALYALSVFLGASGSAIEGRNGGGGTGCRIPLQERDQLRLEVAIATGATLAGKEDASPMVRKELVVLLSCLVNEWRGWFVVAAWVYWEDHGGLNPLTSPSVREQRTAEGALRAAHAQREWADRAASEPRRRDELRVRRPVPEVATLAQTVVDYITALLLESPFSKLPTSDFPKSVPARQAHYPHQPRAGGLDEEKHPRASQIGRMTDTLKRTTSFAATLKSIATGYAFPAPESPGPSEPDHAGAFLSKDVPRPHILSAQYVPPYPPSSDALVMPALGFDDGKIPNDPSTPTLVHSPRLTTKSANGSPRRDQASSHLPLPKFTTDPRVYSHSHSHSQGHGTAADIIEALVEEDLDRLRGRKHRGAPPPPSSDGTESSLTGSALSGLCTGEGLANVLPLKSRYFDWSCEYFLEPQMRQSEEDEPGSVTYNELMWRRQRNEKILDATDHQAGVAPHCPWDRPVSHFSVDGVPLRIKFHQFDPHIAVIDDTTSLSVWDWSRKKKVVTFNNGNPPGSAITGIHFVNEDAQTMIMTASAEGTVRIFRNYDLQRSHDPLEMVTSFRALNHTIPLQKGSGLVTDWQQESGLLLVGGDSRVVRVWDGFQELCLAVSARNLHTNGHMRHLCRVRPRKLQPVLGELGRWATVLVRPSYRRKRVDGPELASPPELDREFALAKGREQGDMTASLDGEVRLWDLRDRDGVGILGKKWQPHGNALANFALHPKAAVFAATSAIVASPRPQSIIVHSIPPVEKPSVLSKFTLPGHTHAHAHISARSPFFAGPSSLSFHPNEMLYATGGIDNIVRVYGCKLRESQEEDVPRGAFEHVPRMNGHGHEGLRMAKHHTVGPHRIDFWKNCFWSFPHTVTNCDAYVRTSYLAEIKRSSDLLEPGSAWLRGTGSSDNARRNSPRPLGHGSALLSLPVIMRLSSTLLVGFVLSGSSALAGKRIKGLSNNAQELFDIAMTYNDDGWDPIRGATGAGSARATAWYAVGLLARNDGSDVATARDIIEREIDAQYIVPGNPWYGTYKKTFEEPIPGTAVSCKHLRESHSNSYDPNWREFVGTAFILAIEEYSDLLGKPLVNKMLASLNHAVLGGLTRVGLDGDNLDLIYTNPALMRAFSTGWLGPTYYGIDMWALSLWTKYSPKNSSLAKYGPLILSGLWDTMGDYYNANLKNFAGPYDRTYGNGALPPKLYASKHIDDWAQGHLVALTCDTAVKHASSKAKSAMTKFTKPRYIERHIRSSETNDTRRPVTTWIEDWAMFGGESISETVHIRGDQFVPGLVQWSPKKGWISWIAWSQSANWLSGVVGNSSTGQPTLTVSYPNRAIPGTDRFTFTTGGLPYVRGSNMSWNGFEALPGIKLKVTTVGVDAPSTYFSNSALHEYLYWNTTYHVSSNFTGVPSISFTLLESPKEPSS